MVDNNLGPFKDVCWAHRFGLKNLVKVKFATYLELKMLMWSFKFFSNKGKSKW